MLLLSLVLVLGCPSDPTKDRDGDGIDDADDCAPDDAEVYPGQEETPYNGVDDDCDTTTPDDDLDGDGFGIAEDCDDADAEVHPGAEDLLWKDGDCDGTHSVDLSKADYSFVGESDNDSAGGSVSSAGDVDGDGLDDLLVGSPFNDDGGSEAGKAYLVLAASLGSTSTLDLSLADYNFVGENYRDWAGRSVSTAGDVDGDGLDDLLLGAQLNDDGGTDAGKAYLVLASSLGTTSTVDLSLADYSFIGERDNDSAGGSVASAGDVDGDGLDDLLLGAKGNDDGGDHAGKAYLFLGASLGTTSTLDLSLADYNFVGESDNDSAGGSVASAGDVDGDGLDDLLLGALGNDDGGLEAGKAYLVLGASLGTTSTVDLSLADYSFIGENTYDRAGSVSGAGDVDGDGKDDLLVGAYAVNSGSYAGKAYLVLAASLGTASTIDLSLADHSFVGEHNGDKAGGSVSSAGDVDGDGLDDLLVGAPGHSTSHAYLILGASLGTTSTIDLSLADYNYRDPYYGAEAGESVSGAGDVNGDGLDDLLVGAPRSSSSDGTSPGKAYLILSGL